MNWLPKITWPWQTAKAATATTQLVEKSSWQFPSESLLYSVGAWPSNTGVPVSPFASLQVAAAYAAIRALCEDISKLPVRIEKRLSKGGWQQANHPVQRLLREPNEFETFADLINHLIVGINLRGNGYAYVARNVRGEPVRLIPILPERCSINITADGEIWYYASSPHIPAEALNVPSYDMVHIKNISLDGGIRGVSPIAFAQDTLGIALAAQRHAALMYRQGTMTSGWLKYPNKLSKEAIDNIRQSFQRVYTGSDNAHKTMILEEGAEFVSTQFSPEQVQLLESRKFSCEEIARLFGVPPHRIGVLDRATFANIEQEQQNYIDQSLMIVAGKIERQLERTLLFEEERDRYRIRFDFDEMLRGDTKARAEAAQIFVLNGIKSRNEVREEEGLPPVEGGDEFRVPANTLSPDAKPTVNTAEIAEPQPSKARARKRIASAVIS